MSYASCRELAELQHRLATAIYQTAQQPQHTDALTPLFVSTTALSANRRLAIYRGSVFENLTQALQQSYPLCCKLLGAPQFGDLARLYLLQHPSRTPNLNSYGGDFADFLARQLADKKLPADWAALPELACLEWAWDQAYYAADAPAFDWQVLQGLSEQQQAQIVLQQAPSAALLSGRYATHNFWQAQRQDLSTKPAAALPIIAQPEFVIIWRRGFERVSQILSEMQWKFLQAVAQRQTLAEIFAGLGEALPASAAELLPQAVAQGWISAYQ